MPRCMSSNLYIIICSLFVSAHASCILYGPFNVAVAGRCFWDATAEAPRTWAEAQATCRAKQEGATLARIMSNAELGALDAVLDFSTGPVWIDGVVQPGRKFPSVITIAPAGAELFQTRQEHIRILELFLFTRCLRCRVCGVFFNGLAAFAIRRLVK